MSAAHDNEKGNNGLDALPREAVSTNSSVSFDKDVAVGLVGEHAREYDPAVEARVLRKIDYHLIPALIVGMNQSCAVLLHDMERSLTL